MAKLREQDFLNNKFFTLWVNNEEKAQVITASAKSSLESQKLPIAGSMGKITLVTGAEGTGSLSFYKLIDDTLNQDINDCIKNGKPFVFDLIGEVENKSTGGTYRVIIENCQITSFEVLNVDIGSNDAMKQTYDFEYNPEDVDIE
ncbi:phage tail tube protein [Clostridium butyricum]